ncbi:MAG TPA: alpha/beta hydrolase [Ktedonobacteraceae bacterium]|nr:alpha/beta hydrolase [Ktedonobacteraceae bacterium]
MECNVRGVPLFYESCGTGIPVILLHGYGSDHYLMKGCMEPIFAQQPAWRRIYLDLPGMGQTPGKEHIKSTDDMLDIVVDFIDAVIPGQQFLLAGESYGGYLARGVVLRRFDLVAGMALICPGIIADRSRRTVPPRTVIVENPQLMASLDPADAEEFGSMAVVQDQYNWQRFRDEVLSGASVANGPFLEKLRQHSDYSFDVDRLPQPFARPVVILLGRQDSSVGYQDGWHILENYPRGTFAILDRAGHNLQIEQPQLFNALIEEWLHRVREFRQPYTLNEA